MQPHARLRETRLSRWGFAKGAMVTRTQGTRYWGTGHAQTDEEGKHVETAYERPLPRIRHLVARLLSHPICHVS